jgi:hypothetical protein
MLCKPASLYFGISMSVLVILGIYNLGNTDSYCGNIQCGALHKLVILMIKMLYILFWTAVLQVFCKNGMSIVSWILVLFPLFLMFLFLTGFITPNVATMF